MASLEDEESEFSQAFHIKLQPLATKFCRKINDLKGLRHSVQDAVSKSQATTEDYDMLKLELENLAELRQKYEEYADEFIANFGSTHVKEVSAARKSVEENINAARNIKVNVDILIRSVRIQLAGEGRDEPETVEAIKDGVQSEHELEKQDEEKGESKEDYPGNGKTMSWKTKVVMIVIGLIIVIVFYSGLGLIIQAVQSSQKKSDGTTLVLTPDVHWIKSLPEFLYIELSFIEVEVEYRDFQLFEAGLVQYIFTYGL